MTTDIIHWPDAGARKGTAISSPHSAEFRLLPRPPTPPRLASFLKCALFNHIAYQDDKMVL